MKVCFLSIVFISLSLWVPGNSFGAETKLLYVLNKGEASVLALDPRDGKELNKIQVGKGPHEAATSPDGKRVVVTNYGQKLPGNSLSILDVTQGKVAKTIPLSGYHRPHGVAFFPDGRRVAVTAEAEKALLIVDILDGTILTAIPTQQEYSHMVALNPEGTRAYVSNITSGSISVLDVTRKKLLKIVPTGEGAEGITYVPGNDEIWVSNRTVDTVSVIDNKTLKVVATIPVSDFPIRAVSVPGKKLVLVSAARSGELMALDTNTKKVVQKIKMPGLAVGQAQTGNRIFAGEFPASSVPIGILVSSDGQKAYVANSHADVISVVDLNTWTVDRLLPTGREPDGMAWGIKDK